MTYALISAGFLCIAGLAALVFTRFSGRGRVNWWAVTAAAIALIVLTAAFDSIMIWFDLFSYTTTLISGIHIGLAPIEDFAYPLAAVVALPALWALVTKPGGVRIGALLRRAFLVSRPVSWVNTAFPFAAAMLMTTREVDWLLVLGAFYYLIPYNLAMYGINDVFDYESDAKNPRKGGIEGALLPPEMHRPLLWLVFASNLPFLIMLVAAGNPPAWIAIAISTFAVIAYSAPIIRLKERPVWDSITSSTHFVSPAIVGFTLTGASIDTGLMVLLAAFFLWGMAAHAFGAVQDINPDRQANIASIATVFGARFTVRISLALWLLAGLLMLATPWPAPLAGLIALPYLINAAPYFNVTDAGSGDTNRAWRRFIALNYFSGFLVTLVLILFWSTK